MVENLAAQDTLAGGNKPTIYDRARQMNGGRVDGASRVELLATDHPTHKALINAGHLIARTHFVAVSVFVAVSISDKGKSLGTIPPEDCVHGDENDLGAILINNSGQQIAQIVIRHPEGTDRMEARAMSADLEAAHGVRFHFTIGEDLEVDDYPVK
jgi:hypothetical protein